MSCLPSLVHVLCSVCLTFLEQHLISPCWNIDGINVATGFDTYSCSRPSCWCMVCCRYIDVFPRVELERRLSTEDLEVEAGVGMRKGDLLLKTAASGIDGNFGVLWIENETVINIRLCRTQGELFICFDPREISNRPSRDVVWIRFLVLRCTENNLCSLNCRCIAEGEVAANTLVIIHFVAW